MNLSEKVEETLDKLKPHNDPEPVMNTAIQEDTIQKPESKMSFNIDDLKDYLLIIICTAICLASVFLLILPQYKQIGVISADLSAKQTELNELTKQSQYLKGLVGLKDELENKMAVSAQALPSTEDRVPYTLDQLVQIAQKSNVEVDSMNLSGIADAKAESGDNLRIVQIQISIVGTHDDIQQFFYNLENARTLVDISTFQIEHQQPQKDSSANEVTVISNEDMVTFSLRSYLKAEIDSENVDLSALANTPNYDSLIKKLNSMDFYDTKPVNIEVGTDNPFGVNESTPSTAPVESTESDGSGIQ